MRSSWAARIGLVAGAFAAIAAGCDADIEDPSTTVPCARRDGGRCTTSRDGGVTREDDSGATGGGDGGVSGGGDGGGTSGGTELCNNGLDDDRNGQIDDNCPCIPNAMQPCFAGDPRQAGIGICRMGAQRCAGAGEFGVWGACMGSGAPQSAMCNGMDNDCDGRIDDVGCSCTVGQERGCYGGPPGTSGMGTCRDGRQRCVAGAGGVPTWGPCEGAVVPGPETCDGVDNNCDGRVDDTCQCTPGTTRACYDGPMGTRDVGACRAGVQRCELGLTEGSRWGACTGQTLPGPEVCGMRTDANCDGRAGCTDPVCAGTMACVTCMPGGMRFELSGAAADVLFVVDRSGSMILPTPDGSTRWDALRNAMRTVLPGLDASLYMGLVVFPDSGACGIAPSVHVPVMQPSAGRIVSVLDSRFADGGTPTDEALTVAENYLRATSSPRRRYIVLATDGAPNCAGTLDSVVAHIARIRSSMMVDTFVLGIPGTDFTLPSGLNRMADAGGRPRAGATRYYEASSTADLERALRAITAATASCTYRFATPPPDPTRVTVQFDGVTVARSASAGWEFTDGTFREIRFSGAACAQLTSGMVRTISASFGCM